MSVYDTINMALMRELERLDDIDPRTSDGKSEISRAKAITDVCTAAVANADSNIRAMHMLGNLTERKMSAPKFLAGDCDE